MFVKADGSLYNEGDIMRRPVLANTLRRIANRGGQEFYTGKLTAEIVADLQNHSKGSIHSFFPFMHFKRLEMIYLGSGHYLWVGGRCK